MEGERLRAIIDNLAEMHHGDAYALRRHLPAHEQALAYAASMDRQADPAMRELRAELLGDVCNGYPEMVGRVFPLLEEMASGEPVVDVVIAIIGRSAASGTRVLHRSWCAGRGIATTPYGWAWRRLFAGRCPRSATPMPWRRSSRSRGIRFLSSVTGRRSRSEGAPPPAPR
jgi:hypothetical protein